MRLQQHVVIVSGAARGIGAPEARALVEQGARVVIGDLLDDLGRTLASELNAGRLNACAQYLHLDATRMEDWEHALFRPTLREFFRQAVAVIDDPRTETHPQEALRKIRKMADTVFDVREAAPTALGPYWNARSPAEREEFTLLFRQLLEQAYLNWVAALIGGQRVHIRYEDETTDGTAALVKTTIQGKDERPVAFDYRMTMRQGRWRIRDVIVDRVSLIDNYRAQFKRVLATAPYSALIASMRAKTSDDTVVSARPTVSPILAVGRDVHSQAP